MPVVLSALCFFAPGQAAAHTDTARFTNTAFTTSPQIVDCTLEDGTETHCQQITVGYLPKGFQIGPFCPATLDDEGGIWEWTGEDSGLYRIDRNFLMMLDKLGYRFYDDDGTVHITDTATKKPDDDHACINVAVDESVEITMLLPTDPVVAKAPKSLGVVGKVGVALDGVPIFSDAPSIQATGHMPALDTCGGHVDPGGWYHWHAASTDVETVYHNEDVVADCGLEQDPTAQFGYAFDGFAIYGSRDADNTAPTDLDACNGHIGMTPQGETVYHYHASESFPNLPPCLVGVQAKDNFTTTATAGVGAQNAGSNGRNEPPRPEHGKEGDTPSEFAEAAEKLSVSLDDLMEALRPSAPDAQPDVKAAAKILGVSEKDLEAALPRLPENDPSHAPKPE